MIVEFAQNWSSGEVNTLSDNAWWSLVDDGKAMTQASPKDKTLFIVALFFAVEYPVRDVLDRGPIERLVQGSRAQNRREESPIRSSAGENDDLREVVPVRRRRPRGRRSFRPRAPCSAVPRRATLRERY